MLFSSRLSPASVVQWCRNLHHGTDIGLSPTKMFRQLAKSGPNAGRETAGRIAERVQKGQSIGDAMEQERKRLPTLFVELVAIGEESGRLTQAFAELERYYETVVSARKQFIQALIYPAFVYVSGILVVALMLFILGMITPAGGKPFDPLGLGLLGPSGAMIFLSVAFCFTAFIVLAFLWVRESDALRANLEALALKIPGLRGCVRHFALQRFSMAMSMTAEAGLKADRCLEAGFRATANETYLKAGAGAPGKARGGTPIPRVLATCGTALFPSEYLDAVNVGEMTGKMPEVLDKQAEHHREEGTRQLKFLTMVAGGSVYAVVGLLIIIVIIRLAMSIGGVYDDALKGI